MATFGARQAIAALAAAALAGTADAQLYIFGMNGFGKVIVNDTEFYSLPSDLEVKAGVIQNGVEEWWDQEIAGSDQYHLRLDGLIFKNGERLDPRLEVEDAVWFRLAVTQGGDVFAFDAEGRTAQNGVEIYDLPHNTASRPDLRLYTDFLYHEGDKYALRNDGKIFRNGSGTEVWDLPGDASEASEDWIAFVFDDVTDRIYALRKDGIVRYVESGGASDGAFVADLPDGPDAERFSAMVQEPTSQNLFAMRFDGRVDRIDVTTTPFDVDNYTDYPGDGEEDQWFSAISLMDALPLALRFDGRIYAGLAQTELCELQGSRYRSIAATSVTPVATNVKEFKTVTSTYTTKCFPGNTVTFPVFASDVNTEDLTLALVSKPEGSTYDDTVDPPVFTWTPDTVGKYELQISVTDGVDTPKTYIWKISVNEPDIDAKKNKKPLFQKLKKVQGLVGVPIVVPLRAFDPDGDALTYSVGDMPPGMTFDAGTATITWIPLVCAEKVNVEIFADDGSGTLAKGKIQFQVETPFWF